MENDLNQPYTYSVWLSNKDTLLSDNSHTEYLNYIKNWYFQNSKKSQVKSLNLKNDYIQLLKDLKFLFGNSEFDNFLSELDFNNDEELIYNIPFFAKKLKQIALVFSKKRESVKQAKLKYNLIGSNSGLEKLLYEFLLKSFSKSEGNITQVPSSKLSPFFPELSAIKDDFYIEIEELHDKNTYLGTDSSVDIKKYVDTQKLSLDKMSKEFGDISDSQMLELISTQFLTKISNSFLSNAFMDFLKNEIPTLTSTSLFNNRTLNVYNQIEASKKYLSDNLYGLTAIKLKETTDFDNSLSLTFKEGNNWFFWPSGIRILDETTFNNTFQEIPVNNSNLYNSGATAAEDYTNSDLIFTDKNGIVEGAWLQSFYKTHPELQNMRVHITGATKREFIFPYAGVDFSVKTSGFLGYKLNDNDNIILDTLNPKSKEKILTDYFSNTLPLSTCNSIYLNNTNLINNGSHADIFSNTADVISKKLKTSNSLTYNESDLGIIEKAYLYKFNKTDLPISSGINYIYWPLQKYKSDETIPLTINKDYCLPIYLRDLELRKSMVGCVAGISVANCDILYKVNDKDSTDVSEAAWLGSPSITRLDILKNAIPVYDTPATKCAQFVDGPIQSSLSLQINSGSKQSFIWMGEDTYADDVIKYHNHLPSCPYLKLFPHDFYSDQDYQNTNPINDIKNWKKCNCKSIQYSPIGHSGDHVFDYNGMADYLFADPDGLGSDFAINTWSDTRGFDAYSSPQFSFFNLKKDPSLADTNVGWGEGSWKTGSGKRMVLKTGRRYTYFRSALRTNSSETPYIILKYAYPNINGLIGDTNGFDLVIVIDNSRSQSLNLETTKSAAMSIIDRILSSYKDNIQIALVEFNRYSNRLSYLSNNREALKLFVSQIKSPSDPLSYDSYITNGLQMAKGILDIPVLRKIDSRNLTFNALCTNLEFYIADITEGNNIQNLPQQGKPKKILLFSDGIENDISAPDGLLVDYCSFLKQQNIDIYSAQIGKIKEAVSYYTDNSGLLNPPKNTMQKIASSYSTYFNLESFLTNGDGDLSSFVDYISMRISGSTPVYPNWYKAIKNSNGNWVEKYDDYGNLEVSDMILRPGDYLSYIHKNTISYNNLNDMSVSFSMKCLSFTINAKLNGWDYDSNTFSDLNFGPQFGARPFWAKVDTIPSEIDNFRKDTIEFGGKIKFIDDYLPVQQPNVSTMYFETGDIIEYNRKSLKNFIWDQPISVSNTIFTNKWKKLKFKIDFSNLKDFLYKEKTDAIIDPSNEDSDITLESYSSFKPALFNYYARNPFAYDQGLYKRKRCLESFVVYNTGLLIEPSNPFENLLNNFQPSIATVPLPYNIVSEKEIGYYMLPENLGASFYRGRGYNMSIDNSLITTFKNVSSEITYFDLDKYGPRQRGLTKKDQLSIVKIDNIDSTWIMEPYSSGSKAGVIINTLENQKLTPYQSSYEIEGKNNYGVSRQNDVFEFWTPPDPPKWNNESVYPLSFRKELLLNSYIQRKNDLLVNKGKVQEWKCDIFSNNFSLYKKFKPNYIEGLKFWFSSSYNTVNTNGLTVFDYDKIAQDGESIVRWADKTKRQRDLKTYYGRPTLKKVSENSKPSVLMDGFEGLDVMKLDYELNVTGLSFFIVSKFTNTIGNLPNVLCSFGETVSANDALNYTHPGLVISNDADKLRFSYGNVATYQSLDITNADLNINLHSFHLLEMHYDLPECYAYIDGKLFGDSTDLDPADKLQNGIYASEGFWVGAYLYGKFSSRCEISEIIFYDRKLSEDEITQIRQYITELYSIPTS
jgi:hypothetical protein